MKAKKKRMLIENINALAVMAVFLLGNTALILFKAGKTDQKIENLSHRVQRLDSHIDKLYEKVWENRNG